MTPDLEQRLLAAQIERALADCGDQVFFVQVGSNDGVHDDPLHDLIRRHGGWRGIFVEPVASVFSELRRNYNDDPRFVFLNVAVGRTRGTQKFHYVSETARGAVSDLPDWYSRIGSFSRAHITTLLGPTIEPFIVEADVQAVPLADILAEHAVESIDLLHIDAEGFDDAVLAQLDFARFRPRVILIERAHLSPLGDHRTRELFRAQGYSCTRLAADYLATRLPASAQAGRRETAPAAPRHAVSYALLLRGGNYDAQVARHMLSVRSLRRVSPQIPVHVHVFSQQLTAGDQEQLERLDVTVRHCGSYRSALREVAGDHAADLLRGYPAMAKWLALQWMPTAPDLRILSLDNDTYILEDLAGLFEAYGHARLCAREEPFSRASSLGCWPAHLDQDALDRLFRDEGFTPVPPFNTGVVMMDSGVVTRITESLGMVLQYLWRFNLWMCRHPSENDGRDVQAMRAADVSAVFPSATALRFPSENRWIKEQVAMWLTLGALGERVGLVSPQHIAQGDEYREIDRAGRHPHVIHYYSSNADHFRSRWLPAFERE
jgi:FkbM family methyltransferase